MLVGEKHWIYNILVGGVMHLRAREDGGKGGLRIHSLTIPEKVDNGRVQSGKWEENLHLFV